MAWAERRFGVAQPQPVPKFVQGKRFQDVRGVWDSSAALKDDVQFLKSPKTRAFHPRDAAPPAGEAPEATGNVTPADDIPRIPGDSAHFPAAAQGGVRLTRVGVLPTAAASIRPAVRARRDRGKGGGRTHRRRSPRRVVGPAGAQPRPANVVADVELRLDIRFAQFDRARKAGKHRRFALRDTRRKIGAVIDQKEADRELPAVLDIRKRKLHHYFSRAWSSFCSRRSDDRARRREGEH